jgi:hypothetical protein
MLKSFFGFFVFVFVFALSFLACCKFSILGDEQVVLTNKSASDTIRLTVSHARGEKNEHEDES